MKVLFLDFDGVLNNEAYLKAHPLGGLLIDPEKMIPLKTIIDKTSAKIVITSSWREHLAKKDQTAVKIGGIFSRCGLEIFDITPMLSCREEEIEKWLKLRDDITQFAVLDDRFLDSPTLRGHFVKCSSYIGLNGRAAEKAIEILKAGE